jgi:hypothetical protein
MRRSQIRRSRTLHASIAADANTEKDVDE